MPRMLTIAAVFLLALPGLAAAEEPHHPSGGKPGGARPAVVPHGPMGAPHPGGMASPHPRGMGTPHPVGVAGTGGPLSYHGHAINRIHGPAFAYPAGHHYRHWGVGMAL